MQGADPPMLAARHCASVWYVQSSVLFRRHQGRGSALLGTEVADIAAIKATIPIET
jgi:hypothetical protein